MGERAEYIRKGTKWDQIVENRRKMIEICPNVDFYISSTVSIYNAWHLVDFHREWVELGLIKPMDWNINILQSPDRDRVDEARQELHRIINDREMRDAIILVFANKQDLPDGLFVLTVFDFS